MSDIVRWVADYSPPIAVALILGATAIYVLKTSVEKAIASTFERESKRIELLTARRSSFEGEVLKERFLRAIEMNQRLERIATNLNRLRHNEPVPQNFMTAADVPDLTSVYEDPETYHLILTDALYNQFRAKADIGQRMAAAVRERVPQNEWDTLTEEWMRVGADIRRVVDEQFGLSAIGWTMA